VVRETCAVEGNLLDAGSLRLFGDGLPMAVAAAVLPPLPEPPSAVRTSASAVEAVASTFEPSPEMTVA